MKKAFAFLPLLSLTNAADVYPMVNDINETCESSGHAKFENEEECFAAAEAMGLQPRFATTNVPRPLGCYRKGTRVYYGKFPNTGGAQTNRKPICKTTGAPAYPWIYENGATCVSEGLTLLSQDECWAAAEAQGLVQRYTTSNPNRPEGCYRKGYKVYYGNPSVNAGNGAQSNRHPICGPAAAELEEEAVQEFVYADNGICIGTVVHTDDSSSVSKKQQCATACKAQGTPFFASTNYGQPSCRCCEAINPESGAGGWSQFEFVTEPAPEVPAHTYKDWGICEGTVVYTDNTLPLSNEEQCAIECKAQGTPAFASLNFSGGQPACRCCEAINPWSGAGGWSQFEFDTPQYEAVFQQGGVCSGSVVYTDESAGLTNKEQCLSECMAQGKAYFANCENCGQPACRCCDELATSFAGGWLQFSVEEVATLDAPVRRIDEVEEHDEDSEDDTIDFNDE